ncbi:NRPS-like enzyme [Desarmillaria tabescens]|uniref:NRPS-like enzyme n=1 Tax=Armillaria tabescens TaxID=1929756 RepID=A0AA39K4H7_ARMTA|nr:NRPS-like enzyme [Desarmillaria tabescens]KAK0454193.1 NRPS-like enzyme [Desarmillaria tabescens]
MAFPTPQGRSSLTFTPPPIDGSLTFPEIIDYNGEHSPNHPLFRYEDPNSNDVRTIHWTEGVAAIHNAGQYFKKYLHDETSPVVVSILANSDTLTFFATITGIMRLGHIPFAISIRNSAPAITHLMKATNSKYLIVSPDATVQKIAESVCQHNDDERIITTIPMPAFSDIYVKSYEPLPPFKKPDWNETAFIMHSSGTTRFPSPILRSHESMLEFSKASYYGEIDLCGEVFAAQSCPMYHILGFWITSLSVATGAIPAHFSPKQPAVIPTAERFLSSLVKTGCTYIFSVPSFLEQWAHDPAAIKALKTTKGLVSSGGPLSKEAGDILSHHGVNLISVFGLTEVGGISDIFPKSAPPEGWEWMGVSNRMDAVFAPTEEEDIYRLYIKKSKLSTPSVLNCEIDGVPAFDTKDLVKLHPSNPKLWKAYGRADDQIMHSTGEKTNPGPIEAGLLGDKRISGAVMFGRGKFQPGVLIQPSEEYAFDPNDAKRLAEYRSLIWDTVVQINESAPQHSRIYKEMILIASPEKPFEFTAKQSLRRGAILKAYGQEIEDAYKAVEALSPDISIPQTLTLKTATNLIRDIVKGALQGDSVIGDTDDIFSVGGDSLTALSIRNSIMGALRKFHLPVGVIRSLPPNFVFDLPTIATLGAFVHGVILAGRVTVNGQKETSKEKEPKPYYPEVSTVPKEGETIVKLRDGKGESPLIMIHGAGGFIFEYASYAEKFRTSVWSLQITPDTPLGSLHEMAAFYFHQIKARQPHGPYRFASYSSTSILLVVLVKLFEDNGDTVSQAVMLDHFPTSFVYSANKAGNPDPRVPENREILVDGGIEAIGGLMKRDANWGSLERSLKALRDAWNGVYANEIVKVGVHNIRAYMTAISEFVYDLTTDREGDGRASMEAMERWIRTVKAPIMVVVTKEGAVGSYAEENREEWADLGVKRCLPDARVVFVGGGHYEFLTNERVIEVLQEGY